MKVLVCISNVPDTTTRITFTGDHSEFNTAGVQFILNPWDEVALARAIELCEGGKGTVTVVHVGEAMSEPVIRKALAIGADNAVRIDAVAADARFTAGQIAAYAKDQGFDLILTGRESIDYNGNAVGAMVAELLDLPSVSVIKKIDVEGGSASLEREIEGGKELLVVKLPLLVTCAEGVAEPRIPNMRGIMSARAKPLEVLPAAGTKASVMIRKFEMPPQRSAVKMVLPEQVDQLVTFLNAEARVI